MINLGVCIATLGHNVIPRFRLKPIHIEVIVLLLVIIWYGTALDDFYMTPIHPFCAPYHTREQNDPEPSPGPLERLVIGDVRIQFHSRNFPFGLRRPICGIPVLVSLREILPLCRTTLIRHVLRNDKLGPQFS